MGETLRRRRLAAGLVLLGVPVLLSACRSRRTVELAWDVPASMPARYRIYVDERLVREIPPPEADRQCNCMKVAVEVPKGTHRLRIDACNASGLCSPSAEVTAQ